jgi:hypothetical protein
MKSRFYTNSGKWLGVISAVTGLVLWLIVAYTDQFYPDVVSKDTWITTAAMVGLAIAGILTALTERPFLMILVFLFSFFPVGLYMLGVPTIFRLIGLSDLFFFVSSILILLTTYEIQINRKIKKAP